MKYYRYEVQYHDDKQYRNKFVTFDYDADALDQARIMLENDPDICFMRVAEGSRILKEGPVKRDVDLDSMELKPCPFCGHKADPDGFHESFSVDSSFSFVGCSNTQCGAMIPYYNDTERQQTIADWNTRTTVFW